MVRLEGKDGAAWRMEFKISRLLRGSGWKERQEIPSGWIFKGSGQGTGDSRQRTADRGQRTVDRGMGLRVWNS